MKHGNRGLKRELLRLLDEHEALDELERDQAIAGLVTDLHHLADDLGLSFRGILATSRFQYERELQSGSHAYDD